MDWSFYSLAFNTPAFSTMHGSDTFSVIKLSDVWCVYRTGNDNMPEQLAVLIPTPEAAMTLVERIMT